MMLDRMNSLKKKLDKTKLNKKRHQTPKFLFKYKLYSDKVLNAFKIYPYFAIKYEGVYLFCRDRDTTKEYANIEIDSLGGMATDIIDTRYVLSYYKDMCQVLTKIGVPNMGMDIFPKEPKKWLVDNCSTYLNCQIAEQLSNKDVLIYYPLPLWVLVLKARFMKFIENIMHKRRQKIIKQYTCKGYINRNKGL